MGTPAGYFRHRVTIQQNVTGRGQGGSVTDNWVTIAGMESVPARITFNSMREFIASQQMQSELVGKISIRYRTNTLNGAVRILHKNKIYNAKGFNPDNDSGISVLTAFVTEGVNEG